MTGKFALVTGSTRGIGRSIVAELLKEGHFVFANYSLNDAGAEEAAAEWREASPRFLIVKADLSTPEGSERLCAAVTEVTAELDYVVLNAGATDRTRFGEITREQWDTVFNVNLAIPFFLCQRVYPMLRPDGRIVFIGSVLGRVAHAASIPYGVSKGALELLAKYLMPQVAEKRVTVNVVAPGFTETDWHKGKDPAQRERIENKIALRRFAEPGEISAAVLMVLRNGYLNGQTIVVDGGYGWS